MSNRQYLNVLAFLLFAAVPVESLDAETISFGGPTMGTTYRVELLDADFRQNESIVRLTSVV
jgi:hypothetical protein